MNSTVALIAGSKDALELFQILLSDSKKNTQPSVVSQSSPFPKEGCWVGNWASPKGFLFECEIYLTFQSDKTANGRILWTLRRTPYEEFKEKLDSRATERVIGSYSLESRRIEIRGVRKEDPNQIIDQDFYRLTLSSDSSTLRGETHYRGNWQGAMVARARSIKNSVNQVLKV